MSVNEKKSEIKKTSEVIKTKKSATSNEKDQRKTKTTCQI
jgi:hypothetical protein